MYIRWFKYLILVAIGSFIRMADDCFVEVQAMSLKKKRRRRHSSFTPIGEDSKSISKALSEFTLFLYLNPNERKREGTLCKLSLMPVM